MPKSISGEIPAVLDWSDVWIVDRKDRQLVVAVLPTTTSQAATLPTTREILARHAEGMNLRPTTRTGRVASHETNWELWHTSQGLAIRTRDRNQPCLAIFPTHRIHGELAGLNTRVDFIVAPKSPDKYRNIGDFLRAQGKTSLCGQALVAATPYHPETPRYFLLNSQGQACDEASHGSTVFIDQNVLVDLKAMLSPTSNRRLDEAEVRDQVSWLAQIDCIPGFALAECASATQNPANVNELRAAWNAWIEGRPGLDSIDDLRASYREYFEQFQADPRPAENDTPAGRGLPALNYYALLSAVEPWKHVQGKRFDPDAHISAFENWSLKVNREGIGVPGHMGVAIRNLLLGKETHEQTQSAAKLLKLNKASAPKLSALQGAAYDMLYPTLCDMAQMGASPQPAGTTVYVLTADKPMANARTAISVGPLAFGGPDGMLGTLSADTPYLDEYTTEQRSRIDEIEAQLQRDGILRTQTSSIDPMQKVDEHVAITEKDLLFRGLVH